MTRSILCGLLAVLSVGALGVLPVACQSGGVGDPCVPEDEYNAQFPGFKVQEENIESRSFQCSTRICLVNHFQGRASCPLGQALPKACSGPGDASCGDGTDCVESQVYSPECTVCDGKDPSCKDVPCPGSLTCDAKRGVCVCTSSTEIAGVTYSCELADPKCNGTDCPQVLRSYLCHKKNNCQNSDTKKVCCSDRAKTCTTDADCPGSSCIDDNMAEDCKTPKDCCLPGTDKPVGVSVCGQCDSNSKRNAEQAVYCSCRCLRQVCASAKCTVASDCPGADADTECDTAPGSTTDKVCYYGTSSACSSACKSGCSTEPGDANSNYCSCPSQFVCGNIRKNVGLGDAQLTGSYCIKSLTTFQSDANCGNVNGYFDPNNCKGTSLPSGGGT